MATTAIPAAAPVTMVRVWDPVVRIGHWVLVATFATAYLSEGEPMWLHEWAGYLLAATVTLRIVWGFVGPEHARFRGFVRGPAAVLTYLKGLASGHPERHLGHSPAGGAMTVALLAALAFTALTGMATLAVDDDQGPLAPWMGPTAAAAAPIASALADEDGDEDRDRRGEDGESLWAEVHELSANLSLALVVLHVAGLAVSSFVHRENLVRPMIDGTKRP